MAFRKLFVEFGGRGQTPVKTAEIQDFGTYFPAWQSHKKKVVMLPRSGEDDDKKQQLNTQLMPIKHSICGTPTTHKAPISNPTH